MRSSCGPDMHSRIEVRTAAGLRIRVLLAALAAWSAAYAVGVDASEAAVTQETDIKGITAQVVQCRRKEGVLTIVLELQNNSAQMQRVLLRNEIQGSDSFYLISNNKKYLLLRDSDGVPIAKQDQDIFLNARQALTWWAKYPAPPNDVTKVDFFTPLTLPFEDLPIED